MNKVMETIENTTVEISQLQVGDIPVNLGEILEIEERDGFFFLVIDRMDERQVWKFNSADRLMVR